MKNSITPVILSGGSGSRLWPLSREAYPKQFIRLTGSDTLIQQTAKRISSLENATSPLVVCNNQHRFLVAEQLQQVQIYPLDIILEPAKRNTAPAIAVAAMRILEQDPECVMLVLPADHLLGDVARFHDAVSRGRDHAIAGKLVTFGIRPASPETGYGYIKQGNAVSEGVYAIERFVEKPQSETAEEYLSSGEYFWNAGIFMFTPGTYLEEMDRFQPEMLEYCRTAYEKAFRDMDFMRLDREAFEACPADSIDFAIMEKTDRGVVAELDTSWTDVGSWEALWKICPCDQAHNAVHGDVILEDVSNSLILSRKRLVAALGVHDLVVVETSDAILVADRRRAQDVKKIVRTLKALGREEAVTHSKVYRPWGSYELLTSGDRFQVKLIKVKPGARLSLQMHHHRAEHWIVVRGTALVYSGDEKLLVTENESTFIPLGKVHSLENPGKIMLELVEVQSGSYLGEDDIVRLEDIYGRDSDKEDG